MKVKVSEKMPRGRPKGIRCKWKGKKLPWKPQKRQEKYFTAKMKKWADVYMETNSQTEASIQAYDLDKNSSAARKYASALGTNNKRHPLIIQYMKEVAEIATDSIVHLAQFAENERVKLSASQDILDRLGYKAADKLEIDDKRELSEVDNAAILKVQQVLSGTKIQDAEIIEPDEQPDPLAGDSTPLEPLAGSKD